MQVDQGRLKDENATLVGALRAKDRKQQQTQELYDRLKRREMTAVTQNAAMDSVDEVLGAAGIRRNHIDQRHLQGNGASHEFSSFSHDIGGMNNHRESSNGGGERGSMMPPPFRRADRDEAHPFGPGEPLS